MKPDKDAAHLEMCRRNPMYFRDNTIVDAGGKFRKFSEVMTELQRSDFAARDECMLWVAQVKKQVRGKWVERDMPKVRRFYTQRSRGYSKTSDIALDLIWMLLFTPYRLDGIVTAEDFDQAALMLIQAAKIVDVNPWMADLIDVQKKTIVNKQSGAQFRCLTSDVGSSFGQTPDVVICDEWSHWTKESWWSSTYSSFNKKKKMIIVGCNACTTGSWQIEKREVMKTDPLWHCSIPYGAAPWQTEEDLNSQRSLIDYLEFQRLWMNVDSATGNKFVNKGFITACEDPDLERQEQGSEFVPMYFVCVDYAERGDRTVITTSHLDDGIAIVDRMDVIDPHQRDGIILVSEVLTRLDEIDQLFGQHSNVVYIFDRHQMAHAIQVLRSAGRTVHEFEFKSGIGNHQASVLLQQYIMEGRIKWYPGCGEMFDADGDVWQPQGRDDNLATELDALLVKESSNKRWRFDHVRNGHDDRSFTLAATVKYISDCLLADAEDDYYESEDVNA